MLGVLCTRPKPWILSALSINVTQHHHYQRCCGGSGSVLSFAEDYNRRRRHHSSACRSIVSGGAASIWHAILPSSRDCRNNNNNLKLSFHHHHEQKGEGSWNVAWDARPARWLHGSDSAWLLFGVCACACVAPFDCCSGNPEATALVTSVPAAVDDDVVALVGKDELETDDERSKLGYRVIGVPADGRCLFRAVSHGACLRNGEEAPDSDRQRELADDLRVQVVDELLKRRKETEWFIEGDFDAYVKSIQEPSTWAGEPELLMSSHVLRTPISVFMIDRSSGKLSNVANYGQEYANDKKSSIKVVFHGYGHYDVLETFGS